METDVQKRIRERAYAIWLEEGCPHGRDTEHWLRAEGDIAGSLTETAPVALAAAPEAEPPAKPKRARSATTVAKTEPAAKAPARKPAAKKATTPATPMKATDKAEPAEPKTPRPRRKTSTAPA